VLWQKATSLSCNNVSSCGENSFSRDTGPGNTKVAFCLEGQKWVHSFMLTPPLKWIIWERYRCNFSVFANFFSCSVSNWSTDYWSYWCICCPKQIQQSTGFFWPLWWGWGGVTITFTKGFLLLDRCTASITSTIRSLLLIVRKN